MRKLTDEELITEVVIYADQINELLKECSDRQIKIDLNQDGNRDEFRGEPIPFNIPIKVYGTKNYSQQ